MSPPEPALGSTRAALVEYFVVGCFFAIDLVHLVDLRLVQEMDHYLLHEGVLGVHQEATQQE
jgi:hypothetical protein